MTLTLPPTLARPAPATQAALRSLMGRYQGPADVEGQVFLAKHLAASREGVPDRLRGNPGDLLVLILEAQSLDIGIGTALGNLFWADGQRGMRGQLMKALIMRAGHRIHEVRLSDKLATLRLERCDDQPSGVATWKMTEAVAAGLTTNQSWLWFPQDCLFWRCLSRLGRRYASDVIQGFYVAEELEHGIVDEPQHPANERPVAPEVVDLLTDLDTLTHAEVVELREAAKSLGLLDEYAGMVGDVPVSVGDLLVQVAEDRRERETAVLAAVTDPPAATAEVAPSADAPALRCACDVSVLLKTGDHEPGCPQHLGARK